jgi:hypothetical protein
LTPAFALRRWLAAVAALASVAGCHARTDREVYETGEAGTVTLVNRSDVRGLLGGCYPFMYEKFEGGAWLDQLPDYVCVWEGIPRAVPPRSEIDLAFTARDAGRWRLRFDAWAGCDEDRPLSPAHCTSHLAILSNDFEVREPASRACQVSGCSGELCASEPLASACVFLPHYVCFRDAVCSERGDLGPRPGCGFERTPELEACLARFGAAH